MFCRQTAKALITHAWPILVAQIASVGMMVVDTAVLGHISAVDLAAVAIGSGIHISIVFALVGVVQAIAPLAAHARGAGEVTAVAHVLHQGLWLAVLIALPGIWLLSHPEPLLAFSDMSPEIHEKVVAYLGMLAWSMLPALWYRSFYAFCNALGRSRVLMLIGVGALLVHASLASWLAHHAGEGGIPLGVLGCALSNVLISWVCCGLGFAYLRWGPFTVYKPLQAISRPDVGVWKKILSLGLPMGFSNFVEITAFTLVSLFIAPLGESVVAGHRIIANLSALAYMLPLSLGIATMVIVGQALGAQNWLAVRRGIQTGLTLSASASLFLGGIVWGAGDYLVGLYTSNNQVQHVAIALIVYVASYQFFDALQTIAGHALRAFHVTFWPMLIQTFCFWGVALGLGWWLCYRFSTPLGVTGFWLGAVMSLVCAACLLGGLLRRVMKIKIPSL